MAAAMLFGGAAAATAEPQADAPQADGAAALSPVMVPAVGIPAVEVADEDAEPALAPVAGAISIEVGPTEEEIAAAEAAEREAAERAAEEQESEENAETREDDGASRSEERSSSQGEDSSSQQESSSGESQQEQSAPAPSASKGNSILSTARSGIGTPYVYGGTSTSGWDCSGFVQWVYGQHGINLPRGAADQAAAGTVIPRSEARPGDLVYKPGHVGIYAGGNQFVDAGNSRVDTTERNIYSGSWTFIRIG
ncbi:C40 family peptidase [Brachybacterium sp. Z12]|uniref:C40 family peptidase n=1 Tax=Brachybacterium sp. Z12 TaxID=2759167 RepID=UPI00223B799B|nr:C40 family peptidase [Brachybacterium sp. Z12]